MNKTMRNMGFLAFVVLCLCLSVWGPQTLTAYRDRGLLNSPKEEIIEEAGEGYRYSLNRRERLYLLAECLNSQELPESERNALTRPQETEYEYQERNGSYAFIVNRKGPSGREITQEDVYEACNRELEIFMGLGILPGTVQAAREADYDAVLYSAIDVLEPRNNVAVWKLSLTGGGRDIRKENRLMDVYLDADDGKIYEFYARTPLTWEEINPDEIIETWSGYMGLGQPAVYESENPLTETTPYFKKYVFDGMGDQKTIVTVGFYEGINELFLKISK